MGKKFNFFKDIYDPLASRLKPIVAPLSSALTQKAVDKIAAYKTGGVVKGPRGKPTLIRAHGGEVVLPLNAKPTATQKKIIAKNKAAAKKKK